LGTILLALTICGVVYCYLHKQENHYQMHLIARMADLLEYDGDGPLIIMAEDIEEDPQASHYVSQAHFFGLLKKATFYLMVVISFLLLFT